MGQPRQRRGQGGGVAVQARVAAAHFAVHISGNVAEIIKEIRDKFPEIPQESESVIIIGGGNKVFVLCSLLLLSVFLLLSENFYLITSVFVILELPWLSVEEICRWFLIDPASRPRRTGSRGSCSWSSRGCSRRSCCCWSCVAGGSFWMDDCSLGISSSPPSPAKSGWSQVPPAGSCSAAGAS